MKIERISQLNTRVIRFNKRVAAYCRISMECDRLNNSLANQISYYKDLITHTKGYDFIKVYYDRGISGTGLKNRDSFNEMIEDAKAGKIDLIYTKSISRFARNTVDLLNTVRLLKSINVGVIFEKENINTLTSDGEFMLTILASFAQSESENISSNCRWGIRKRMEQGIISHKDLFGYDYDKKTKKYSINKEEGKIIKEIFKRFNNGETYTEIAEKLREREIKTRNGLEINYLTVRDFLKQEKYAGYTVTLKRYVCDSLTHKAKRNKGEVAKYKIDGTHPAIISKEEFEKAQERIKYIAEHKVECHKQSKWFTGLVKCPVCGRSMIVYNSIFLRCIGACKYRNCDNKQTLKISELEEVLKDKDKSKIEKIIFKKIRLNRFSRKGIKPGEQPDRNIRKEDFEIIWKH